MGEETQIRGEQRKMEGAHMGSWGATKDRLGVSWPTEGCSLPESSEEQMFPYLPCY